MQYFFGLKITTYYKINCISVTPLFHAHIYVCDVGKKKCVKTLGRQCLTRL